MMNSELWISLILVIGNVKVNDAANDFDANLRAQYYDFKTSGQTNRDESINSVLGLPKDCSLTAGDSFETAHGTVRQRFKETFKNIPIADTVVEIDIDSNGNFDEGGSVGGKLIFKIEQDIPYIEECILSLDDAFDMTLNTISMPATLIVEKESEEEIYIDKTTNKARLVWSIDLIVSNDTEDSVTRHFFRIDRCNSEVAQYYISRKTFSPRLALPQEINMDDEKLLRNMRQATIIMGTGSTEMFTNLFTDFTVFTDSTVTEKTTTASKTGATPSTSKPPTTKSVPKGTCTVGVKGFGGNTKSGKYEFGVFPHCLDLKKVGDTCTLENEFVKVVDMKQGSQEDKTDIVSYNCKTGYKDEINGGFSPVLDAFFHGTQTFKMLKEWYKYRPFKTSIFMLVHFRKNWANAMFGGQKLIFGDGDDTTYPLVSLDTVAHETGHGVTAQSSQLAYQVQSGGLDEAFCDIMGEVAEAFLGKNDWLSGYYDDKNPKGALRYFVDPTKDGNSIKHVKDYTSDMDVHYSSGVINHMFYLLVTKQNVPIRYAFEAMLTANRMYWRENSDFEDAACGVLRAAYDNGLDTGKFRAAFKAVGINGCALVKYLVKITATKPRSGIKLSSIKQPIFLAIIPVDSKTITVTVTAEKEVGITLSKTLSMANTEANGINTVTHTVTGIKNLYIRLGGEKQSETTATLTIKYT